MALTTIFPNGTKTLTVAATESIAISNYGGGIARIYYLIETANYPPIFQFQQILEDSAITLGAFSIDTVIKIESGASTVIYDVGTSPDTGVGDADTLGGELPNYYATDSLVVHKADTETVTGTKTFEKTVTVSANLPVFELHEADTTTYARFVIAASKVFLQAAEDGQGASGGGDLIFSGWGNTVDLNSFLVRIGGADQTIYHTGINASLGDGNGVSGSFTTSDAKTITVTNGIITAIV